MKNSDKFSSVVSHDPEEGVVQTNTGDNSNSGKFDVNGLVGAIGSNINSLLDLFKKPDTYNTYNITQGDEGKKDNTMLYIGIGGVILVVILFIVIAIKK